ncbi:sensor histidine kinase [Mucilaginibacter terrae]|uniref:Two-component system LytT family sensor kinase n=1 Tax=Mucilaginibacter terrae TaxID=1955052 RepID=A0ABU3GU00_9SPHI|nr:histidine kinase [Mucilaginibacter terrae]MDT3403261.1 two-component system LytT family sensor kinase [Mucilaginibacter terrae]
MKRERGYFQNSFWYHNKRNSIVGIGVGIIIVIIKSTFNNHLLPLQRAVFTVMFSVLITLSITNSVLFYARFLKPQKLSVWKFILVYYICNLLGMFIGVELSYLIISLIFQTSYIPLSHVGEYKFTFIIVLIVGTVIYVYNAQKEGMKARLRQKELDLTKMMQLKTQAELQTLQSKINPHFLYNSLNSIASLIHEDADKAEDMTLKLSKLFRYSINSQQENMASVKDEMEIVNTYLDIEKVRFGDRLKFNTYIDPALAGKHIPRFLIQPLVENALKHGLNNTAQNGILAITLKQEDGRIIIEVEDNGAPFPTELNMGYGLQSTYDKLKLLYADDYEMQLINTPRKYICINLPLHSNL